MIMTRIPIGFQIIYLVVPLDNRAWLESICLISPSKHMLWILRIIVSIITQTRVKSDGTKEDYNTFACV